MSMSFFIVIPQTCEKKCKDQNIENLCDVFDFLPQVITEFWHLFTVRFTNVRVSIYEKPQAPAQ